MRSQKPIESAYQKLDAMANHAQKLAHRTRTMFWTGALVWMLVLQAGATWSVIPVATLIPVSYPVFVWIKQRVESGRYFQVWCNARMAAEIARVLCVYDACGRSPQRFIRQLTDRLLESRKSPRRMITQLLSSNRPHGKVRELEEVLRLQNEWMRSQYDYLARTMPRREREAKSIRRLSEVFYGSAIALAFVCVISALAGHRFMDSWISFLVFTAPAIASVIGIFYSDIADTHDIARYRALHARYQLAIEQLDALPDARQALAVFDQLAYMQTVEVLDWWREKVS